MTGEIAIPLLPVANDRLQRLVEPLPSDSNVGMGAGMQQSSAQRVRR